MYADYAARLLREKWSALARPHLRPDASPEELRKAIEGLADGLDRFVEEIAVLFCSQAALTQRAPLTVVRGGIQDLTPPDVQWPPPIIASAEISVQACQYALAGTTPQALLLTFTGTPTDGSCESCIDLINSGPYVLDQDPDDPCRYTYSGSISCGDLALDLTMSENSIVGTVTIGVVPEAQIAFSVTAPYDGTASRTTTLSNISVASCDLTDIQATITGTTAASSMGGMTANNIDQYFALFKALNWGASYDCDTKTVHGGFAAIFKGPVYMDNLIAPDGRCLNVGEAANVVNTLTPVRRIGDVRIVQSGNDYVLQAHEYTDLVAKVVTDHGWIAKHTFPTLDISGALTWNDGDNKKLQQVMNASVSVVGLGTESTEDILTATYVSQFVKQVHYDTVSHILYQAHATDIYVFEVGVSGTRIVDIAEPCSSEGATELFYAEGALTIGAATCAAEASHTVKTYTASAAGSFGAATCQGSAGFTKKTVTASAAITAPAAICAGQATYTSPA